MKLAMVGDIALFGQNSMDNRGWKDRFAAIKKILDSCDCVVGNLETPLTNHTKTVGGKSAYIKGTPKEVEILNYLGFTHVSLANNHMYDYCEKGLLDTISCLENHSIEWYGINGKTIELDKEAILMGFCCYSTNAVGLERKRNYINLVEPSGMEACIRDSEKKGLLPILSCHWGEEHIHYPAYEHIRLARNLAERHTIVIHGHHPHVIQGIEHINNSLINYSLGNFCFDDVYTPKSKKPLIKLSQDNQESYILILTIEDGILKNYEIIPFSFENGYYAIKNEIALKLKEWSEHLNDDETIYNKRRSRALKQYLDARRTSRNVEWYIKRMTLESIKMILRAKWYSHRYKSLIEKPLSDNMATNS